MEEILKSWVVSDIIRPFLDIGIITILLYSAYKIFEETRALQLLKGLIGIIILYIVAFILQLETLLWVLNKLAPGVVIALAIIFQPELRKFFVSIGQRAVLKSRVTISLNDQLQAVLNAVRVLSGRKRGALIVFNRKVGLKSIIDQGIPLNADVSSQLIRSIFEFDTPLHDGAVVILNGRIVAAGCYLPLSKQHYIKKSFGTRHRAALGLAEETDAIVLILSEETGACSLAYDSNIHYDLDIKELDLELRRLLDIASTNESDMITDGINKNE